VTKKSSVAPSTPAPAAPAAKKQAPAPAAPAATPGDPAAEFEGLLARCGVKDRTNLEKHLALCDAEPHPGHAKLWRRLAGRMAALGSLPVQTAGPGVLLFFIPDGKYRLQVFSLEDRRDGQLLIYTTDVLDQAVAKKILAKAGGQYVVAGNKAVAINVEQIDAANTPDPAPHYKHLIGWNRKAIRITLNASEADSPVVGAVEAICALAAKQG
jgi:hypothetical protein